MTHDATPHEVVTLKLPKEMLSQAQVLASARGLSIGDMLRQYLTDETRAHTHPKDRSAAQALTQLVPVFSAARNWEDLMADLAKRGFALRPMGTGLAVYGASNGKHLCNAATVGHRYRKLVKRFGCPMPGHPHGAQWLKSNDNAATDAECTKPQATKMPRTRPLN